jgi:hypothetical protein
MTDRLLAVIMVGIVVLVWGAILWLALRTGKGPK